jgi:hypothetical protein
VATVIPPLGECDRRDWPKQADFASVIETVAGLTGDRIGEKNPMISGRSGRIRTCDPCVPNAVLYRAEPHSDKKAAYSLGFRAPQEAEFLRI